MCVLQCQSGLREDFKLNKFSFKHCHCGFLTLQIFSQVHNGKNILGVDRIFPFPSTSLLGDLCQCNKLVIFTFFPFFPSVTSVFELVKFVKNVLTFLLNNLSILYLL